MSKYFTSAIFLFSIIAALTSCRPTQIQDGKVAYDLKKYQLATELLPEEYNKASEGYQKSMLAWKIAESYRFINNTERAAEWYNKAFRDGYGLEARVWYAKMLQASGNYEQALKEYEAMIKEEPFRRAEFATAIAAIEQAIKWKNEANYTTVTNLNFNSANSDFAPAFFENKALVYASSRSDATGEDKDLWTGDQFYDLFIVYPSSSGYSNPEKFTTVVNTAYNEATVTFNADYTEMYFTSCGSNDQQQNDFCNIYFSERLPEGGWSEPQLLQLFTDSINVGHPVLSKDGNVLIYSAADLQGYGGTDLYFSVRNFEGWSSPISLGSAINTPRNEAFPYLDAEGNLYFSSDGYPGMGGLDIYKATPVGQNKWANVQNMGYPINSNADDFGVIIETLTATEKETVEAKGFLTSNRAGGKGSDDIYEFKKEKAPPKYELQVSVKEKKLKDPKDPNSEVLGLEPLRNAKVLIYKLTTSGEQFLDTITTDQDATFTYPVEAATNYKLFATKDPGYFSKSETVSTRNKTAKPGEKVTVTTEIVLDKIFEAVEIVIPNIYYDYDEFYIREDAAAVLDTTILPLLKENPSITVEIGSHTDARGSNIYNRNLSQKRAEAVVEYLTQKGINPQRLQAQGYGESQPVNKCVDGVECTEEEYQRNRRTTFKVLSDQFDVQSVEPENIKVDPKKN